MATIDNLAVSILDMDEDQVFALVKDIRAKRRTKPDNPRQYKKNKKGQRDTAANIKGRGAKIDANTLAKTMTKEQKEALLRELGINV